MQYQDFGGEEENTIADTRWHEEVASSSPMELRGPQFEGIEKLNLVTHGHANTAYSEASNCLCLMIDVPSVSVHQTLLVAPPLSTSQPFEARLDPPTDIPPTRSSTVTTPPFWKDSHRTL